MYLPPEEVYDFLVDFPRYANYSKHLTEVVAHGEGGPGTEYDLRFEWWKLSYTARSRVTAVDPPERIDWAVVKDLDATGYWLVEATDPPAGEETATRVTFHVEFDADSADTDAIDLPSLVSLGWVIDKVKPKIKQEAERVVRRIVADIEGEDRPVDLEIRTF